jgi:transcriptional regulator with XRE-family HTH domain
MNYSLLKKQILVQLRGKLSQQELSRKLGYSYNQVGKWETDAKRTKWKDFSEICEVCGVNLEHIVFNVFLDFKGDFRDSKNVFRSLQTFNSLLSAEALAKKLNCHPSVVKRWIAGSVQPDIEVIFQLLDLRQNFLPTFISQIVDIEKIDSLRNRFHTEQQDKADFNDPIFLSVWLAVRLKSYKNLERHDDSVLAKLCGLSEETIQHCLPILLQTNHLRLVNGLYQTDNELKFNNMHGDRAMITRMRTYWTGRSLSRFDLETGKDKFNRRPINLQAFAMRTVSKEAMEKITIRMHKALEEVLQIAEQDTGDEEELRIILMDVFSAMDAPMVSMQQLLGKSQSMGRDC